MNQNVELLAPAGSFEILKAVIAAGANAVYLGGSKFGARAYANNFTEEEMLEALDYAHLRGVKIYLTVNTLLKNKELNRDLYDYLLPFYKAGLDAVLVQDIGVLDFIKANFPGLPIHASTQMTVSSKESALYLKGLGVSRVVVSRELSLNEIKEIYDETHMELEAFVHGALCYSYSGMCLFSSMLGGRSGNRGRCAQPCRLPYQVAENGKKLKSTSNLLSLKDLCGINALTELTGAGVCSLKIEGRMKQLSYAFGVTSVYRKALDSGISDKDALLKLGNRGGFTDSYYYRHNDSRMITYEDSSLHAEDSDSPVIKESKLKINGSAVFRLGKPAELTVSYLTPSDSSLLSYTAYGNPVDPSQSRPLIGQDAKDRLMKTGQTDFIFDELSVELDENVFVPNGALNSLRRDALNGLKDILLKDRRREEKTSFVSPKQLFDTCLSGFRVPDSTGKISWSASAAFRSQLKPLIESPDIETIYLGLDLYDSDFSCIADDLSTLQQSGKTAYLKMPGVLRNDSLNKILPGIRQLDPASFEGFLVNSLDSYAFCRRYFPNCKIVGDYGLYTFNDVATAHFLHEGAERLCAPLELNRAELQHRFNGRSEIIVYGRYPLMQAANCVCKNTKGCTGKPQILSLKDRKNTDFPVINHCSYCYNTIYNSLPTNLLPVAGELKEMGFSTFRLEFTDESSEDIHTILRSIRGQNHYNQNKSYTYGHYKRGVE